MIFISSPVNQSSVRRATAPVAECLFLFVRAGVLEATVRLWSATVGKSSSVIYRLDGVESSSLSDLGPLYRAPWFGELRVGSC